MLAIIHAVAAALFLLPAGDDTPAGQPACHSTATPTITIEAGDRKGQMLKQIHERLIASRAPFFGEGEITEIQNMLARLPANAPPQQLINLKGRLAELLLASGEIDRAISLHEDVLRQMQEQGMPVDERFIAAMRRLLQESAESA